ncbi:hypothetical protein [Myxosarcina sp. GI1]|uniref:hypothetical protein n=1 Tax=Myxosarcina sp. GI1 TaxID=1541065 RepID=UPI00055A60F7|nr:hypothetical protein [Myxosarcina sp. GI1]
MKIYTFNAAENTRVEILWSLRPKNRDKIFEEFITKNNWTEVSSIQNCQVAIYPYKVFNPETLAFDASVFDAAEEAVKYNKPLVIDATSDSDVFLDISTANILRSGLYKSLKKTLETECPYWSDGKTKDKLESLDIGFKSSKPAVGFCGTTSSIGKLFKIGKVLPLSVAQSVLSQGAIARRVDIRLKKGMSHKLRAIAINLLEADPRIDSCFDITNHLDDYYDRDNSNRNLLENLFIKNMLESDYALCVRANGNYSGRFYMALNAGRIPVVIDTDVVIPYEDKLHIIKIPVDSLSKIADIILEHFERTSDREFREMKRENRSVYQQFLAPEKFLPNFLKGVVERNS